MAVRALMTAAEIAKRLQIHRITVYRLIKKANLPGFKIGRVWRFDKSELERWLVKNQRPTRATNHRRKSPTPA